MIKSFRNSKKSKGAIFLVFVIFLAFVTGFILLSLQIFELVNVKRVGTDFTTARSYLAAEGAIYATVEQIKSTPGWPGNNNFSDSYKLDGVKIDRKITVVPGGTTTIDIQTEFLRSKRRIVAEFVPPEVEKLASGNPVDMILVIDRSSSMKNPSSKFAQAILASKTLVNFIEPSRDQVGVVFFDKNILWVSPLTSDTNLVRTKLNEIKPGSGTHILEGLYEGHIEALSERARPEANQVIVFLSDGKPDNYASNSSCNTVPSGDIDDKIICEADLIKADGITIYSIAYGGDADIPLMQAVATSSEYYYYAPKPLDLVPVSTQVGNSIVQGSSFSIKEVEPE